MTPLYRDIIFYTFFTEILYIIYYIFIDAGDKDLKTHFAGIAGNAK